MAHPSSELKQKVEYIKAPKRDAQSDNALVEKVVKEVLAAVRERGDAALRQIAMKQLAIDYRDLIRSLSALDV